MRAAGMPRGKWTRAREAMLKRVAGPGRNRDPPAMRAAVAANGWGRREPFDRSGSLA